MKKQDSFLVKIWQYLLYSLPAVLFFSYYPLISFGSSESMYFELSLPLIWLVIFDVASFALMIQKKCTIKGLKIVWPWLLLPVWLSLSVIWSFNALRGLLVVGILWLIYFAGYAIWNLKKLWNEENRDKWWKWFFGSTIVTCLWCFAQCLLDLVGVTRECSLMCEGCTYVKFGFPHPNGFAIEPQFMGNLLLAPAIVSIYFLIKKNFSIALAIMITATLFLTFSRGAIYAFVVAVVFMSAFMIFGAKKKERKKVGKRVGLAWGVVVFSFLFTLNLQGIMADISPTNDTYKTGVAKVLDHLSLGVIDIRDEQKEPVENSVENNEALNSKEEAEFDGYVAESTDVRMKMSESAINVWSKDFKTIIFGVGLGGAGEALYQNGYTTWPKEIIQNQYVSLLLEAGLVGVVLFVFTIVLMIRLVVRSSENAALLSLLVAYAVSLLFFAGLPNALQIYLTPMALLLMWMVNLKKS